MTEPRRPTAVASRPMVVLAIAALAIVVYTARIRHEMIDFVTWRQAVVRALHAEPLYPAEVEHYDFKYFPAFAIVMAPFGVLDEGPAKAVWFAFEVALIAVLLRGSISALPDRRRSTRVLFWVTLVVMAKFLAHELVLGQTNLLLAGLMLAALLAIQQGRLALGGALAGAAAFVKPYALILLPWLLITQGWRSAVPAIVVVIIGLLLPVIVYGWSGNASLVRDWWTTVSDSTAPLLLNNDNVSVAAMWAKWIGIGPVASVLSWLTLAAVALLVVMVVRGRGPVPKPEYLEVALLMLLVPLVSPQGWDYVLLLGTPAVVCLVDRWRELSLPWRSALAIALPVMGLTMFDLMGRGLYNRFMGLSLITVCALVLAVGLAHMRRRRLA